MSSTGNASAATPAQIAKGALRRLAAQQLEPTPEHFARAYAQEAGVPVADGRSSARARPVMERLAARLSEDGRVREDIAGALIDGRLDDLQRALDFAGEQTAVPALVWMSLIQRTARGLERGGRHWTGARKKLSLQRVIDGSGSDAARFQQRLAQLLSAWEDDSPDSEVEPTDHAALDGPAGSARDASPLPRGPDAITAGPSAPGHRSDRDGWPPLMMELQATLQLALPRDRPDARALADELDAIARRIVHDGALPEHVREVAALCEQARSVLAHNHHLVDELGALCRSLTDSLGELAEDRSWAQGQCDAMRERLAAGVTARGVRAAGELLEATRTRQRELRVEREQARDALKRMIQQMLTELGELGEQTGRFNDNVLRHAETIARADSLQSLAGVVHDLVGETQAVHAVVQGARTRLSREHARAAELEARVRELESELRRLADEVSTDALTQVANRRGLLQAFEVEQLRAQRESAALAIGLIDIDNFKRLNDSLGHAAGDQALKALAARVRQSLRPVDHVARFGGEEFVVMLPGSTQAEAQQALTRLQRELSANLFMHEGKEVFVTFSAGVTLLRAGESLDAALERADRALYEAKRTGKNRTCTA